MRRCKKKAEPENKPEPEKPKPTKEVCVRHTSKFDVCCVEFAKATTQGRSCMYFTDRMHYETLKLLSDGSWRVDDDDDKPLNPLKFCPWCGVGLPKMVTRAEGGGALGPDAGLQQRQDPWPRPAWPFRENEPLTGAW